MDPKLLTPSKVEQLSGSRFDTAKLQVSIKRDDQIHDVISGNKWRKLRLNLAKAEEEKYAGLLTFGGAFSNHLVATAQAANAFGLKSIGIVRGEELKPDSNETLKKCQDLGMKLVFTSREEYALRAEKYYEEELRRRHGNFLLVPEGGANYLGMMGCIDILNELEDQYDHILLAGGTGTTCAGLLYGSESERIHLFPALKNGDFLRESIEQLMLEAGSTKEEIADCMNRLSIHSDYHFGGYAKYSDDLIKFMNDFYKKHEVPLDYIYTAKMTFGFFELIKNGAFAEGDSVLLLHTGGLQGNQSIKERLDY